MYLVLTALLALNVSAEILNAFKTVDNSLHTANNTIDSKNKTLFASFEELKKDASTKERADIWQPRAQQAQEYADAMITYIDGLKQEIKKAADQNEKGEYKEDNLEAATRIMTDPGTKGQELLNKLTEFKTKVLAIDPEIAKQFKDQLPIDLTVPVGANEGNNKSWSASYFNMTPAIAAVTILSKFQNDVKNSEAMVVDYCHQQVGAVKVVYDQYTALVGQNSTYFMPGQDLIINAGIGSYNSAAKPTITVDGAPAQLMPDGTYQYKSAVGGTGSYTKRVHVSFFNQAKGGMDTRDFDMKYEVGSPTGASVSADDVKALYIGLDNHLSISGGNVGAEKVHPSIDNGSIKPLGGGKYIANPTKPGTGTVTLNIDGQKSQTFAFKVRTVPDPVAKVGASGGGRMKVNEFINQFGLRADLENFIFEGVKFQVTGYTIIFTGGGFPNPKVVPVQGAEFTEAVKSAFGQCKPGTTIAIDDIRATGPGGSRALNPIVFNLTN